MTPADDGLSDPRAHRSAVGVAVICVAVAAAFLVDGWSLKPGTFEPIGSGTVPNGIACIVIALALAVGGQAIQGLRRSEAARVQDERWFRTVAAFAWTAAYALVLSTGAVRYQWATAVYGPVLVMILADRPLRILRWAAPLGIALAFGLDYVFRRILVTDIP